MFTYLYDKRGTAPTWASPDKVSLENAKRQAFFLWDNSPDRYRWIMFPFLVPALREFESQISSNNKPFNPSPHALLSFHDQLSRRA